MKSSEAPRTSTEVATKRRKRVIGLAAIATSVAFAPSVDAQAPPPAQRSQVYSVYEQETIAEQLAKLHEKLDPAPEGKRIERVDAIPLEVFEPRDPLPQWLNVFHATTRRSIIRRELLVGEGSIYQQALVDETLRNLRRLPELSLVLVVATQGSSPGRVGLVIITKDVWSLRLSWNISVTPGGIEQLLLAPTETNLLGSHQAVRAEFVYEPSAYTFGLSYTIPRIDTSRIALVADANVMVNRATGDAEGTFGSLVVGQPIYSGLTEWAWNATVLWQDAVLRRYVNAELSDYHDPSTGLAVPFEYRSREYGATYEVTRSFGWDTKHDITLAAQVDRVNYPISFPGADPRTVADFVAANVPRADTRVGPSIQYHTYTKRYLRLIDLDTLSLQEDVRLGHDVVLRAYPSFEALGASRNVLSLYGAAQYTVGLRDGFVRASISSLLEREPDRVSDAALYTFAHLVTPSVGGLGRIVVDGGLTYRYRNYLNTIEFLGGDGRLRGFPTSFFVGQDVLAYNVEARSRPIEVLSLQLAGVAFYDVGDAFNGFSNFQSFQSVGVGFRALFPWLDRLVFRADIGFPIKRPIDPSTGEPIPPYGFIFTFDQAFDLPTVSPAAVLPTGQ